MRSWLRSSDYVDSLTKALCVRKVSVSVLSDPVGSVDDHDIGGSYGWTESPESYFITGLRVPNRAYFGWDGQDIIGREATRPEDYDFWQVSKPPSERYFIMVSTWLKLA